MNLVERNPFRILGLLVGATAREQGREIRLRNYLGFSLFDDNIKNAIILN
jgi:hypothetical protein